MVVYSQVSTCKQQPEPFKANWAFVQADAWLVSILLQGSIDNEKCHLPDVRFGTVFMELASDLPDMYEGAQHQREIVDISGKSRLHMLATYCINRNIYCDFNLAI